MPATFDGFKWTALEANECLRICRFWLQRISNSLLIGAHIRSLRFVTRSLGVDQRYFLGFLVAIFFLLSVAIFYRADNTKIMPRPRKGSSRSRASSKSSRHSSRHQKLGPFDSLLDERITSEGLRRSRSGSQTSYDTSTSSKGENEDMFELWATGPSASKDNPMSRITYYGPTAFSLVYESIVPPPSWLEVSRQIIPADKNFQLQRHLVLTVSDLSVLRIHHATNGHTAEALQALAQQPVHSMPHAVAAKKSQDRNPPLELSIDQVSIQVLDPIHSGVVKIYVKDSPPEEWMEHTFPSAATAAQFQTDVLALQILGPAINNMYQALQLIHQGSIAYEGKEFVWHDKEAIGNDLTACDDDLLAQCCNGIAWDDCLRIFGSEFPSLRLRLEALWWKHATDHSSKENINMSKQEPEPRNNVATEENSFALKTEYVKKRLLIGPVDFFRLFVPHLPKMAFPRNRSSRVRVDQMFRWRKRVSRASVLVNAYCNARRVVNIGWTLAKKLPDNYWKRRLAFDDNIDNVRWDSAAEGKNVYYEGTVSRDIVCQVRGNGFLKDRSNVALSMIQAFTLVGVHTFKSQSDADSLLRPDQDPVLSIPSLKSLITENPDLEFFISCIYVQVRRIWHIAVFVRSLPEDVDLSFDSAFRSFKNGEPRERDRKLEIILHLGSPRDRLKWKAWLGVNFLSLLSFFNLNGDSPPIQTQIASERTPVSAIPLSSCGNIRHFGGSLQECGLPKNYVAHVATLSSTTATSLSMRTFLLFIERPVLEDGVIDISYVLAGETENELPERVLASYRMVQMKLSNALPLKFVVPRVDSRPYSRESSRESVDSPSEATMLLKLFVTDPFLAAIAPLTSFFSSSVRERKPSHFDLSPADHQSEGAALVESSDPLERAVNELINALWDVHVAVRLEHLHELGLAVDECAHVRSDGFYNVRVVRMLTRGVIRRFFVASRCNFSIAAARIVQSMSWRGRTFPIDYRLCRIELQSGQFFQQGHDKRGFPVFYFRNMLLGPWRRDENAAIAAVLTRLDRAMRLLEQADDTLRCTLVVCLGKPHKIKKSKKENIPDEAGLVQDGEPEASKSVNGSLDELGSDSDPEDGHIEQDSFISFCNPRVEPDEIWSVHTSKRMVRCLVQLLLDHYPERLHRAYIVVAHGDTTYARTAVGGLMKLSKYIPTTRTRDKVKLLIRYSDLREYIDRDELITYCGGNVPIQPAAFEAE